MLMEVRLLHPENALPLMLVTLLGMVTEVRLLHPENAQAPILITLLGIVTEVRPLQFWYLQVFYYQLFTY